MSQLENALKEVGDELTRVMECLLPKPQNGEARVAEAARYSAFSKGKRLRPFLVVCSSDLFGVSRTSSLIAASAIEFIHTYSLIHDDLPAMDNDPMRRGQPSCHIKFDEPTAILAGDGLLTLAFQVMVDERVHADPKVRVELVRTLAVASGINGMVGGQMMDMLSETNEFSVDEVIRMQRLKTGELFALACETGAILGKASDRMRTALRNYAHNMGLAFQIADDLMDADGITSDTGKGGDVEPHKRATLVSMMGRERAQEQAKMLVTQAIKHLDVFDKKADLLRNVAEFAIERSR